MESKKPEKAQQEKTPQEKPKASKLRLSYVIVAVVVIAVIIGVLYATSAPLVVAVGDNVSVYYTGSLTNGTVFGTNVGGTPFNFIVRNASNIINSTVIPGFDLGVIGMKLNETKNLTILASEAYGGSECKPDNQRPNNAVWQSNSKCWNWRAFKIRNAWSSQSSQCNKCDGRLQSSFGRADADISSKGSCNSQGQSVIFLTPARLLPSKE